MGKRSRRRGETRQPASTTDYADAEGNVLTLRDEVSAGTAAKLREPAGGAAATADDAWRRRTEMLFERYAVRWTIAGLPLTGQKELLGRYRMADQAMQSWVRETIEAHVERRAAGGGGR
ncbi:MAG TPA: hypothetical protein VF520_07740 [Thermoleophilaceae bacterium]